MEPPEAFHGVDLADALKEGAKSKLMFGIKE